MVQATYMDEAEVCGGGPCNTPPQKCSDRREGPRYGGWDPRVFEAPRVVASGVDTFVVAFYANVPAALVDQLEDARERARAIRAGAAGDACEPPVVTIGQTDLRVSPDGQKRYAYVARGEDWRLQVARSAGGTFPQLRVQIYSHALWRDGAEDAYASLRAWVEAYLHEPPEDAEPLRAVVSRVDVCADVENLGLQDSSRLEFTTRAKRCERFEDGTPRAPKGLAAADRTWWSGRELTGFMWGRRRKDQRQAVARAYDKTREIKVSGKGWFEAIWSERGWTGGRVDRMEFELGRGFLSSLRFRDEQGADVPMDDPRVVLAHLGDVWRYLVGAKGEQGRGGWLTWREPDGSPQPTRWPVRPAWEVVRGADLGRQAAGEIVRRERGLARVEQLVPQIAGCASSAAASAGLVGVPFVDVWRWLGAKVHEHTERRQDERQPLRGVVSTDRHGRPVVPVGAAFEAEVNEKCPRLEAELAGDRDGKREAAQFLTRYGDVLERGAGAGAAEDLAAELARARRERELDREDAEIDAYFAETDEADFWDDFAVKFGFGGG